MSSSSGSGSGASSGAGSSAQLAAAVMEGDLKMAADQRKRRRMLSNRESARRSRQRKQKHLEDLAALVAQLRRENNQILTGYHAASQRYLAVESENSVLRTQIAELGNRLQSLNDILQHIDAGGGGDICESTSAADVIDVLLLMNPWNQLAAANQPILAAAEALQF